MGQCAKDQITRLSHLIRIQLLTNQIQRTLEMGKNCAHGLTGEALGGDVGDGHPLMARQQPYQFSPGITGGA